MLDLRTFCLPLLIKEVHFTVSSSCQLVTGDDTLSVNSFLLF
jgi:hypothetical protein